MTALRTSERDKIYSHSSMGACCNIKTLKVPERLGMPLRGKTWGRKTYRRRALVSRDPWQGLFTWGQWYCDCKPERLPAERKIVTKKRNGNLGRHFWGCQNWREQDEDAKCDLLLWEDDADKRAATATVNSSRTETRPPHENDCRQPPQRIEPSVTPAPSYDFRALNPRRPSQANTAASWPTDENVDQDKTNGKAKEGIADPVTPGANRTDHIFTPRKRKHSQTGLESSQADDLPRLIAQDSGYWADESSQQPKRRAADTEFFSHISSQGSPTPARRKNAVNTFIENTLFKEISEALDEHGIQLDNGATTLIQEVCTRHHTRVQVLLKRRERICDLDLRASQLHGQALEARLAALQEAEEYDDDPF